LLGTLPPIKNGVVVHYCPALIEILEVQVIIIVM